MIESKDVIEKFYSSFQKKDWKGMQECYHDHVTFHDPVFKDLTSTEVRAMWHMLVSSGKDLTLEFNNIKSDGVTGSCHWIARYTFSRTGRKVKNSISAHFEFSEGKIIYHRDSFNLWKWSGMAIGLTGLLLGWTPFIKARIRSAASKSLERFIAEHIEYAGG